MAPKCPPPLKDGDRVAIVSPAGKINQTLLDLAVVRLRDSGFVPVLGPNAANRSAIFAGTDSERAADLQWALNDAEIKAIFFSRGGYGCLRTSMLVDWSNFVDQPKWLIGFSDITVFHALTVANNIVSIHGGMSAFMGDDDGPTESYLRTIGLLKGELPLFSVKSHPLNRVGVTSGQLFGGNLSIIQSLRGTPLDIDPEGKILFIEDIGEYHYHIDRMMMNLKAGKVLERISGLVVGHFTDMRDGETPYGMNSYEIIREAVENYHYPLLFGFPAGHELPNMPLIMGGECKLAVDKEYAELQFSWLYGKS